ncbi:hypothetical protein NQZ79_g352 [Umbelopsis isabellina]|nr:hypothetical protein NQZ79_g352 [Umbelopsis isabellina]
MALQPPSILDDNLAKRNNVAALLAREIVFREARQPDHKLEALRKKYTPINEIKATESNALPSEEAESFEDIALVDENGFEKPARQLFDPNRLQLTWQRIRPVGLGIENLGNTCFLSSTLQALTYIPAFAQYLLSEQHGRSCKFHDFCVLCALEQHVKQALEREPDNKANNSISPTRLVGKLRAIASTMKPGRQEDAHEFLRHLMHAAQKCCLASYGILDQRSQETTVLHQIFGGYLQSQIECFRCKTITKSFEPFLDLSVDIHAGKTLTRALEDYTNYHQMNDDNKYHCESCDDKVAARKRITIYKAPKALTIHLKRFSFKDGRINKVDKLVTYKEQLDIRPHVTDGQQKGVQGTYNLLAVLVHSGATTHSGHYVCYTKSSNGLWYCMNDTSVQQVSSQTVLNQKAYILFYGLQSSEKKNQTTESSIATSKEVKKKEKHTPTEVASKIQEDVDMGNGIELDDESSAIGVKISRKEFAKTAPRKVATKTEEEKQEPKIMTNKERKRLRKEKIEQARLARQAEMATATKDQDHAASLSGPSTEIDQAVKEMEAASNVEPEIDEAKLEEQQKLAAAMSAAAAIPTVSSSSAVVVNYNDKMEEKRAKLDAVIKMETTHGKSEDVKRTIFGVGSKKGQFGKEEINRWDGDDEDQGTVVSEADREAALRKAEGKRRKRVDAYDVDYDRGRVKKVKKKSNQHFDTKNKFQLQLDIENNVKVSANVFLTIGLYDPDY